MSAELKRILYWILAIVYLIGGGVYITFAMHEHAH